MKLLLLFIISLSTSTTFANRENIGQVTSVTCSLEKVGNDFPGFNSAYASFQLQEDAFDYSEGLDVDDKNYSFTMSYSNGMVSIIIEENNQIQDEVGSLSFMISGDGRSITESIYDNSEREILTLTCWENF